MGNKTQSALLGIALFLLAGCSDSADRTKKDSGGETRTAKTDAEMQAELDRKKDVYRKALADRLAEFDRQALDWKEKIDKTTGEAKKRMQEELDKLNELRKDLGKKAEKLKETSSSAWDEFSSGLDKAAIDLRSAFDKARDKFK